MQERVHCIYMIAERCTQIFVPTLHEAHFFAVIIYKGEGIFRLFLYLVFIPALSFQIEGVFVNPKTHGYAARIGIKHTVAFGKQSWFAIIVRHPKTLKQFFCLRVFNNRLALSGITETPGKKQTKKD